MHIHVLDQYASASGHGLFEPSDNLKVANWDLVCNLDRFQITKVKLVESISDEVQAPKVKKLIGDESGGMMKSKLQKLIVLTGARQVAYTVIKLYCSCVACMILQGALVCVREDVS